MRVATHSAACLQAGLTLYKCSQKPEPKARPPAKSEELGELQVGAAECAAAPVQYVQARRGADVAQTHASPPTWRHAYCTYTIQPSSPVSGAHCPLYLNCRQWRLSE
jgi:hypothetical protein